MMMDNEWNKRARAAVRGRLERPGETLTALYLLLMLAGMPLIVCNGFFDITETKQRFFLLLGGAYVLCMLLILVAARVRRGKTAAGAGEPVRFDAADVCALAFAVCFALSAALSGHAGEAIFGQSNRYQGLITACLYVAIYVCLSRSRVSGRWVAAALTAGFSAVCLLAALNAFGVDPLGLYAGLSDFDRARYVSTIGNINFYSGYVSLFLPVVLTLWCFAETRPQKILHTVGLVCGALGMFPTGSESFGLALLVLALLPLFLFDHPAALRRFLLGVMLMLVVLQAYAGLARVLPTRLNPSHILLLASGAPVTGTLLFALGLLWHALRRTEAERLPRFRRAYGFLLLALAAAAALLVVLASTVLRDCSFGALDRYIKLGAGWGTDRGKIWAYCLNAYRSFDLPQQLFGGGPGCLYRLDAAARMFGDAVLDSAHNEYLHYLLTVGVLGLAAYLGWLICTVGAAWRRAAGDPLLTALLMGVLAYAAQAFVNIAQPASTPYFFLCLGLLAGRTRLAKSAPDEPRP